MQFLATLEHKIIAWTKTVPHLPSSARTWLGNNIWWITLTGAIILGLSALSTFFSLMSIVALLGTVGAGFYAASTTMPLEIVSAAIGIVFIAGSALLLAFAVKPLQHKQKKGWVLLFASWLLMVVLFVVTAVLSFDFFGFIVDIIFGAVCVAISGYFLFEIHSQFAHVEKSAGVKAEKEA